MTINIPSADDIKAAFTFSTFTNIDGEPSYQTLYRLEIQATRNAATVAIRLPPPHTNCSGLVEQPAMYVLRVGAPFPRPPFPGDAPTFPPNSNLVQRTNIQNQFNVNLKNYTICQTTENLLKTMVENAIESPYLAGIHTEMLGFGNRTLQDIFQYLYQCYGRITPNNLKQNTIKLTTPIDPNLPIAMIFKQIEECQRMATAGRAAFTPDQIVKAAETLILHSGKYQIAYREWIALPEANKTYNEFKTRFSNEYQLQNELNNSTADEHEYANNINEDNNLDEAFNNFAMATAADRTTITQLTETNASLSSQNNQLQAQLNEIQSQLNAINFAQQQLQKPQQQNPPPQSYTIPPQQQIQLRNTRGRGGQIQTRGGRTLNRNQQNWPTTQNICLPTNNHNMQNPSIFVGSQQQNPNNIYKRYNNWNYCFTHGFDVGNGHTSATCRFPNWNHNYNATRNNIMGGSIKNVNKIMPIPQQAWGTAQNLQNS